MAAAMRKNTIISKKKVALAMGALASMQAMAGVAEAGTNTSTLYVKATVSANCLISNATMDFGQFTVLGGTPAAPTYATQSANVAVPYACTNGAPATIYAAAQSLTLTGAATAANTLVAGLYSNSGNTTPYPTAVGSGIGLTGTGVSASTTIYGQIITLSTTKVDTYSGAAILTISY
jgi:spore coat protein U-like protein